MRCGTAVLRADPDSSLGDGVRCDLALEGSGRCAGMFAKGERVAARAAARMAECDGTPTGAICSAAGEVEANRGDLVGVVVTVCGPDTGDLLVGAAGDRFVPVVPAEASCTRTVPEVDTDFILALERRSSVV